MKAVYPHKTNISYLYEGGEMAHSVGWKMASIFIYLIDSFKIKHKNNEDYVCTLDDQYYIKYLLKCQKISYSWGFLNDKVKILRWYVHWARRNILDRFLLLRQPFSPPALKIKGK